MSDDKIGQAHANNHTHMFGMGYRTCKSCSIRNHKRNHCSMRHKTRTRKSKRNSSTNSSVTRSRRSIRTTARNRIRQGNRTSDGEW